MSGLVTFLLFAAFFYLMMQFGCGSHMVHGNHGGHGGHGAHGQPGGGYAHDIEHDMEHDIEMVKDPVCGMEVASGEGYAKMLEGAQYRFCSRQCLDRFDADPDRYVPQVPAQAMGGVK